MSKRIEIQSAKLNVVFRAGELPRIDDKNPTFTLSIGSVNVAARINGKAARKLAVWPHGAVLQGRLVCENGRLVLNEAGFQWIEPKPPAEPAPVEAQTGESNGT